MKFVNFGHHSDQMKERNLNFHFFLQVEKPVAGEKPKGASVRDLINNMNKDVTSTASTEVKRKVSSLPRGTLPPGGGSSELTTNLNPSANSPKLSKKTDSTSDDPRILKLEDDYAYDGVMDV